MDPMTAMLQSLGLQMKSILIDAQTLQIENDYKTLQNNILRAGVQAYCPYRVEM